MRYSLFTTTGLKCALLSAISFVSAGFATATAAPKPLTSNTTSDTI